MRGSLTHSRWRLYATVALALAMVAYLAGFTWAFVANASSGDPPEPWGWLTIFQEWLPSATTAFLLIALPPVLLLTALIVSGRYRRSLLAGLSLAIGCFLAAGWAFSLWHCVDFWVGHPTDVTSNTCTHFVGFRTAEGGVRVGYYTFTFDGPGPDYPLEVNLNMWSDGVVYPFILAPDAAAPWAGRFRALGFEAARSDFAGPHRLDVGLFLILPYWLLLLLCLPCPAWWLYRRLRPRVTTLPGHCATCGYDLRAHLEGRREGGAGDKCPECGTPVSASAPAK